MKNTILLQLPKSLLKPLAMAVHETTKVVPKKSMFSNEKLFLAMTFLLLKMIFLVVIIRILSGTKLKSE